MKRELFAAASLIVTHAYSRRAEEFCRRQDLTPEFKKRILRSVDHHCQKLLSLAGAPGPDTPRLLTQKH